MEFAADRPRWRQVHEVIVERIRSGVYPPRTKVPSTVKLTEEFGIANVTAQKVLRRLREDGLVYTVNGMGSFVTDPLPPPTP
ncbi:GntR family transcriptional regulator [Streptomyces sp. NPDC020747]|uniref:GntR family transcriptional regulator n=1 Tax=Streptomyces sp. NPDC020747 TaxID=3365086 RepID=UPI0037983D22